MKKVEASSLPLPDDVAYYPRPIALKKRPYKKRKEEETSPLSALPYDVALSCLARVPISDHPALYHLSKSYRSLMSSPEVYKTRSQLCITETDVYVSLRTSPDPNPAWYILRRSSSSSSSNLIPISSLPSSQCLALESSVVALGSAIYVIGGMIKGIQTPDVFLLDCLTHTWHRVPPMGVARASAAAAVVNGKIYVVGGCKWDDYSSSWGEVFDPETQTWESLPSTPNRNHYVHGCVVREGKIYAVDGVEKTHYYSPSEGKWGEGNRGVVIEGPKRDWCMIGNVIYSINRHGRIYWCAQEELDMQEPEGMDWWNEVKGLEALTGNLSRSRLVHFGVELVIGYYKYRPAVAENRELASILPGARLGSCGGNMLLFWDVMVGRIQQIWCAEVSLERRGQGGGGEIWGNIEWSHAVMTIDDDDPFTGPHRCKVLHSVSVTL